MLEEDLSAEHVHHRCHPGSICDVLPLAPLGSTSSGKVPSRNMLDSEEEPSIWSADEGKTLRRTWGVPHRIGKGANWGFAEFITERPRNDTKMHRKRERELRSAQQTRRAVAKKPTQGLAPPEIYSSCDLKPTRPKAVQRQLVSPKRSEAPAEHDKSLRSKLQQHPLHKIPFRSGALAFISFLTKVPSQARLPQSFPL